MMHVDYSLKNKSPLSLPTYRERERTEKKERKEKKIHHCMSNVECRQRLRHASLMIKRKRKRGVIKMTKLTLLQWRKKSKAKEETIARQKKIVRNFLFFSPHAHCCCCMFLSIFIHSKHTRMMKSR